MTVRYLILLLTLLVSIGCGKDTGLKAGGGSWVSGGGGGSGTSSVPTVITYSPSGTPGTYVYSDWSLLYADTSAITNTLTINFDCSHVASICSIPSGTWDFASTYLRFIGPTNPNPGAVITTVDFASGALLHNPPLYVRNIKLRTSASSAPIQVASGRGSTTYELAGSSAIQSNGSAPVFSVDSTTGEIITLALYDRSNLLGVGGSAPASFNFTGSATFFITVITGNAQLASNSYGAPTAAQTLLQYTDAANLNTSQSGILDTHTFGIIQQLSKSSQESYTDSINPTVGSTNVQGAIDALKPVIGRAPVVVRAVSVANTSTSSAASTIDGVTLAAGDRLLLAKQTTTTQQGVWQFVSAGAALIRPIEWKTGTTIPSGMIVSAGGEGTTWANTLWKMTAAANVVDTGTPVFYPKSVTKQYTLSSGSTGAQTDIPILSTTKSNFFAVRITAGGTVTSTIEYGPSSIVAGAFSGSPSITWIAQLAAGTVNTSDTSVINATIQNW